MAGEDDLREIKLKLSLLSGEDSEAARQLASSLKEIAVMFKAIKDTDFARQAENLAKVHSQLAESTKQINEASRQMQRTGNVGYQATSTAQAAARVAGIVQGNPEEARQRLADAARQSQTTQKQEQARMADRGGGSGGTSPPSAPPWQSKINELRAQEEMNKIPRFGQLNIQDYLNSIASGLSNRANKQFGRATDQIDRGMSADEVQDLVQGPQNLGRRAAKIQRGANWAGVGYTAYRGVTDFRTHLAKYGFDPSQAEHTGRALGYQRGGDLFGGNLPFGIGMEDPFNPAAAEGIGQAADVINLRSKSGINGQEAQAIEGAAAGAGFGGNARSDITQNLLAPLFQKYGLNPEEVMQWQGALRTGQISTRDLAKTLDGLGETARSANMTLTDTAAAIKQASDAVQGMGGTARQGIQFGQNFQSLSGLPANVGGQLLQNPMVQTMLANQTGVMPGLQGVLPTNALMGGISSAISTLEQAYKGFPGRNLNAIDPTTGKVLYTSGVSSQQQTDAMVAKQLGLDYNSFMALKKNQKQIGAGNALQGALQSYQGGLDREQTTNAHGADTQALQSLLAGARTGGKPRPLFGVGTKVQSVDNAGGTFTVRDAHGVLTTHKFGAVGGWDAVHNAEGQAAQNILQQGADGKVAHWDQIQGLINRSGLWGDKTATAKELQKLNAMKDPRERIRTAQSDLKTQMDKLNHAKDPTLEVAFKGQAAKFFSGRITGDISRLVAQAGGDSITAPNASPQGAFPLEVSPGTPGTGP